MVTTSRMIVVLRGELGTQLSSAQKEKRVIEEKYHGRIKDSLESREWKGPERKEWVRVHDKCRRLKNTVEALGSLQLGDLEDKDYEGDF